ncbi:MAG: hypothetical protein J3Q66DRAFT_354819 [Benniella sp.]|nr:MAG: hypothetical protein J3Q66DRAFT_354819 [Benniella sp.]
MPKEKIRYRCTHGSCEQTYASPTSLSAHIRRAHLEAGQGHKDNCQKVYSSSRSLRIHLQQVHETYACTIKGCGQEIVGKEAYQDHLATHRPFVCTHPYCSLAYTTKNNLRDHVKKKHSGAMPSANTPKDVLASRGVSLPSLAFRVTVRHKESLVHGIPYHFQSEDMFFPVGSSVFGNMNRDINECIEYLNTIERCRIEGTTWADGAIRQLQQGCDIEEEKKKNWTEAWTRNWILFLERRRRSPRRVEWNKWQWRFFKETCNGRSLVTGQRLVGREAHIDRVFDSD